MRLECEKEKLYLGYGVDYFYIFDEDAFVDTVADLKCSSFETSSFRDDRIEGTLTVPEGQERVMTTIPYDEAWVITANGERVTYEKTLGALIAFDLPAGEYDIVLKYSPSCVKTGALISAGGVLLFAGACVVSALRKKKKRVAVSAPVSDSGANEPGNDIDFIFDKTDEYVLPETEENPADWNETFTIPEDDENAYDYEEEEHKP